MGGEQGVVYHVGYNIINTENIKKKHFLHKTVFSFSPFPVHSLCSSCRPSYHTQELKLLLVMIMMMKIQV